MARRHEIDFTEGPLIKKMIIYALPIIGVNVLQLLFGAADIAVLGIFTNDQAVAAVGATTNIINLLLGFFTGMSVATNVFVARAMGAKDKDGARRFVGTSVAMSLLCGVIISVVGIILSEKMLIWTNCDEKVLPYAIKYLRIYMLGTPIILLYNFCASILRAVGDTLRPLIFLMASGVANVGLNVFFVVVVGWDIEGVAIATVASQAISAVCSIVLMFKNDGFAHLSLGNIRLRKNEVLNLFKVGIPLGASKITFSFANVIIYSKLNLLGDLVMAANSIAKEFDAFILEILHGFSLAALAIISQNLGAKKMPRIKKTIFVSSFLVTVIGIALGVLLFFFSDNLCDIMTDTPEVIEYGVIRLVFVGCLYFICGIVNVIQESIRGLGYSNTSLVISIIANIAFRIFWILVIYPMLYVEGELMRNYTIICLVWPLSWCVSLLLGSVTLVYLFKKTNARVNAEIEKAQLTA